LTGSSLDSLIEKNGIVNNCTDPYPLSGPAKNGSCGDIVAEYRVNAAATLTILVGIVQIVMGAFGLGIISVYFNEAFVSGYTCSSAIHVLTSQIKDIFGIKGTIKYNGFFNVPRTWYDLLSKLGKSNWLTCVLSAICIVYLLIMNLLVNPFLKKKFRLEFPKELFIVIIVTIASYFLKFSEKFGVSIVATIPSGMPSPNLPDFSLFPDVVSSAITISIIAFSINISLAKVFSQKHGYKIESTQELYAYGLSNIFSSFFSCFPSAASLSRSSVLENSGGKTAIGPFIGAIIILVVILVVGPLFEPLPKACLASIIVVALRGLLLQVKDLLKYWKFSKIEFVSIRFFFIIVITNQF
jgi:solute carrier family 26, other